jgi:diguanylate cyclase (GGDEF)-like protein/PAS domain S-box-containing protein
MTADCELSTAFDVLLRHASAGIGGIDPAGRWRASNRALRELLARESGTLPDLPALFDGRYRKKIEAVLTRLASGERDSDLQDLALHRPDGRTLQVRLEICRIGDQQPPESLLVMFEDITASLQIRKQLRTSEARMQSVIRAMAEGLIVVDGDGGVRIANARAARLLSIPREQLLTSTLAELSLPIHDLKGDALAPERFPVAATLATGQPQRNVTLGLYDAEDDIRWVEMSTEPVLGVESGQVEAVVATFSDITRRYMAELRLRDSEERLSLAMSGAKLGFWDWELRRRSFTFSDSAARLLGYAPGEVAESLRAIMELVHRKDRGELERRMQAHLDGFSDDFEMDLRMQRKSGGYTWINIRGRVVTRDPHDEPERLAGTFMDISERKRLESRLNELATTDGLTGAFNRRHGQEWLEAAVQTAQRLNHPLGFVLLDIDHFKQVNDRFGHDAGDDVLQALAGLLRKRIRRTDAVARWGGEEFAVVLPGTDENGTRRFAEELLAAIRELSTPDGQPITASLGAVVFQPGESAGELVKRADRLMYRAKQSGRDRVVTDLDPA